MLSPATAHFLNSLSSLLGWAYFAAWSFSFWPQPWENFNRKSTYGTNPAFPIFNVVGYICYSASQLVFYFSPVVQEQYRQRNNGKDNLVRVNDVGFALHALLLSLLTLSQFWPKLWQFEKRVLKVEPWMYLAVIGSLGAPASTVGIVLFLGDDNGHDAKGWAWISVLTLLNYIKVIITFVKYIPQVWTNYQNQSTAGWTIIQILLDLVGGVLSIGQLAIDAFLQGSVAGIMGNEVKLILGMVSIFFDVIFMVQHYYLYRDVAVVLDEGHSRDEEGRSLLPGGDSETEAGSQDGEERDLLAQRKEEDEEEDGLGDGLRRLFDGFQESSSSGSSTVQEP